MIYFLFGSMAKNLLKLFKEQVNMFHPTIKFTAEYSKVEVNFLNVNIKLINRGIRTNLLVEPTDAHQKLSILTTTKKGITYSKALRPNRISAVARVSIDAVMI